MGSKYTTKPWTAATWQALTTAQRQAVLDTYYETEQHISPDAKWEELPHWLRRSLVHTAVLADLAEGR